MLEKLTELSLETKVKKLLERVFVSPRLEMGKNYSSYLLALALCVFPSNTTAGLKGWEGAEERKVQRREQRAFYCPDFTSKVGRNTCSWEVF